MDSISRTPEHMSSSMTDNTAMTIDDRDSSCPTTPESPIPHKRHSHRKKTSFIFDPKQCPWQALRDVIFMKQQLGLKNPDICKVLRTRYEDHQHITIMISSNVNMMNDWWYDPMRPDSHLPLNHGIKDYAELALSIKKCLRPAKPVLNIAPAPVPDDSLHKILPDPRPKKRASLGKSDRAPSNVHIEDAGYLTGVSSTSRTHFPSAMKSAAGSASQSQSISQTELTPHQYLKRKSMVLSELRAQGDTMQKRHMCEEHEHINLARQYPISNTASPYLPTSQYRFSAPNITRPESDGLRSTSLESSTEPRAPAHTSLSLPAPPWTTSTFPTDNIAKRDHDAINEEEIPFNPQICPWHALRDSIFGKNEMDMTKDQVCVLLRYRYGAEYPCMRTLRVEDVASMWDFCAGRGRVLYEQNERGMMQIEAKLMEGLRAATRACQGMDRVVEK